MKYFQDKVGHAAELFADYPIDNATVINEGSPVKISNGKVVAAVAAGTDSLLGVAAESHAGAEYALELKDRRKKIGVYDSPHAIFKARLHLVAATDGTGGLSATLSAANTAKGGVLVCTKAVSGSGCVVGEECEVTENTTSLMKIGKDTKTGDEFDFIPPVGFAEIGFETKDGALTGEFALSTTGASLVCAGRDGNELLVAFKKHIYGCGV